MDSEDIKPNDFTLDHPMDDGTVLRQNLHDEMDNPEMDNPEMDNPEMDHHEIDHYEHGNNTDSEPLDGAQIGTNDDSASAISPSITDGSTISAGQPHEENASDTLIHFAGDDVAQDSDQTPLIRRLREQIRDLSRQVRSQARAPLAMDDAEPVIPHRPSIEACDYDPDRFEKATDTWLEARDQHTAWQRRRSEQKEARRRMEEAQARTIEKQRTALGVADYETQAARVKEALSDEQLGLLVAGADNPAQLIYALGRSSARLDTLAACRDLARFAVAVGKLEKDVKVTKRQAPKPETRVSSTTGNVALGHSEKRLAELERQAERSGDRTAIIAYRRQQRAAQQQGA